MVKENLENFSKTISKKRVLFDLFLAGLAVSLYYGTKNEKVRFWLFEFRNKLFEDIKESVKKK